MSNLYSSKKIIKQLKINTTILKRVFSYRNQTGINSIIAMIFNKLFLGMIRYNEIYFKIITFKAKT